MQTRSAVEIARSALAKASPGASDAALDEAARLLVRWGLEGHGASLDLPRALLMVTDLEGVMGAAVEVAPEHAGLRREVGGLRRPWRRPSSTPPGGRSSAPPGRFTSATPDEGDGTDAPGE
ncbi:hypothetical protein [Streptomyces physcomitrii]|uniref:Uncharacterized protein n=1 Tax=Streptomyces physcomitrii TaxID=2724184 RepID=A0ABX1H7D4_9ACTN|nr:hypothetical protein [Streptomyces physcomitrii]NKI43240.1 hypothetical protein [Streptomyces physcomitrii]